MAAGWLLRRIGSLEGTQGEGEVQTQRGAVWLVRTAGATMLPVAIRGTRRPAGRSPRFRPRVDVLVGEPFAVPPGKGRAALIAAAGEMRNRLTALVTELDGIRGLGRSAAGRGEGA